MIQDLIWIVGLDQSYHALFCVYILEYIKYYIKKKDKYDFKIWSNLTKSYE